MRRIALVLAAVCVAAAAVVPVVAEAQLTSVDAGAAVPGPSAGTGVMGIVVADAGAGGDVGGCVESVPKGATRPIISETFPVRGTSGWAATLSVTVRHGKGERVLPAGLDLASAVDAKKYLQKAGFAIPDQDGGAAAHLWTEPEDKDRAYSVTHLELPLVVLPDKPGRNLMMLPPMPVAVARERRDRNGVHALSPDRRRGSDRERASGRAEAEPAAATATRGVDRAQEGASLGKPRSPRRRAARVFLLQAFHEAEAA